MRSERLWEVLWVAQGLSTENWLTCDWNTHLQTLRPPTILSGVSFFKLFIYLLAVLGLHCCAGFSLVVVCGLLIAVASPVVEQGLKGTGSIVVVHGFSCSTACGILPDRGLNPCLLHWQVDSLPLSHLESLLVFLDLYGSFPNVVFVFLRFWGWII